MATALKTQSHLLPQDAKNVDPSKLTALTPEVVSDYLCHNKKEWKFWFPSIIHIALLCLSMQNCRCMVPIFVRLWLTYLNSIFIRWTFHSKCLFDPLFFILSCWSIIVIPIFSIHVQFRINLETMHMRKWMMKFCRLVAKQRSTLERLVMSHTENQP